MSDIRIPGGVTRRGFLCGAAALALAHTTMGRAQTAARSGRARAYVGTYTGKSGNGEGIYLVEMNRSTGELTQPRLVARTPNPSWLVPHPMGRFLYAVNEVADYSGNSGSVSAFSMSPNGDLHAINTVSSEGAEPAHLSIDATGNFAFVANYGGSSIAVLPIAANGSLGAAIDVHRDHGAVGSEQATDAPAGSFAVSGHDAPHAHMILAAPDNRFVLATDLGQDRTYVYRFDAATGKLTAAAQPYVSLPSGDGPRHFAFHPNGRWLFAIQEEASTIARFEYDAATGRLEAREMISTLPDGFSGTNFASEILVAPAGKFLYAGNRLHDSIAVFAIGGNGVLSRVGECATLGDYPGQFRIEPGGRFLFACNKRSDCITGFRIDLQSGMLTPTGQYIGVGSPASITFPLAVGAEASRGPRSKDARE
jgi:6-phosphogluconolactonase (cycloisomerase 2 family)